jgi:hypothetical protein
VVEHDRLAGMLNRDHVMQYLQLRQLQTRQPGPASSAGDRSMTSPTQRRIG